MGNWYKTGHPPEVCDAANELIDQVFADRKVLNDSGESLNRGLMGEQLRDLLIAEHQVEDFDLDVINKTAATKLELTSEWLRLDGGDASILSATDFAGKLARTKVIAVVWEISSTSLSSPLNRKLQFNGGPALIETTVPRHYTAAERTDLGAITEDKQARFVTTNINIILEMSNDREVEKFRRAAVRYNAYIGTLGERLPQHREVLQNAADKALPSITAAVSNAKPLTVAASTVAPAKALSKGSDKADSGS